MMSDPKSNFRAARKPGPNDRVIELSKPLGIVLEEDEKGNVYVKGLTPGGNAARVRKESLTGLHAAGISVLVGCLSGTWDSTGG